MGPYPGESVASDRIAMSVRHPTRYSTAGHDSYMDRRLWKSEVSYAFFPILASNQADFLELQTDFCVFDVETSVSRDQLLT